MAAIAAAVAKSLADYGSGDWYAGIVAAAEALWRTTYDNEGAPFSSSRTALVDFKRTLAKSLALTGQPSDPPTQVEIDRVANWATTFTTNDAIYQSARVTGRPQKQWVTKHDDRVRHAHAVADGQTVHIGGTFSIDGYKLRYPGEPVGPASVWINCRCIMQPKGKGKNMAKPITAAAGSDNSKSAVVVALPAKDHPVNKTSSEQAHMTLAFMGDPSTLPPGHMDAVKAHVAKIAAGYPGPVTDKVAGRAQLGDDKADVALTDANGTKPVRDSLLDDVDTEEPDGHEGTAPSPVRAAMTNAQQFPNWTPHVTLGYPETPANDDPNFGDITFDRLAVWDGDDQTEYPLGGDAPAEPDPITADAGDGNTSDEGPDIDELVDIPFHGIAMPLNVTSGDGRNFHAATWRELPLPFFFQDETGPGHDGAVRAGRIDTFEQVKVPSKATGEPIDAIAYSGFFNQTPAAARVIEGIVFGDIKSVSVDLGGLEVLPPTDEEMAAAIQTGQLPVTQFPTVQIAGLTAVGVGAFEDAYIALGECDCPPEGAPDMHDEQPDVEEADQAIAASAAGSLAAPGLHKDGTPPVCSYCDQASTQYVLHSEGMAFTPACDDHIGQAQEDAATSTPDGSRDESNIVRTSDYPTEAAITAAAGTHDGPGWITTPIPTARIRRYWTHGEGAAKIKWGIPGDFNRCRSQLAKYILNPEWLAGACANMHKEAIGIWPGQEDGKGIAHDVEKAASVAIVASAATVKSDLPREWFDDPKLAALTPVTITPEGRVFGHLAAWGTCHVGMDGVCTTPPRTFSNDYPYFSTGIIETDDGIVQTGHLAMETGHPSLRVSRETATAHYDDSSKIFADVAIYEDEFGIAFSGAARGNVTPEIRREVNATATLSGDWRPVRGQNQLIGATLVNYGGFPVPRTQLAMDGLHDMGLIASGVVQRGIVASGATIRISPEQQLEIVDTVKAELAAEAVRQASLTKARRIAPILRESKVARARRIALEK